MGCELFHHNFGGVKVLKKKKTLTFVVRYTYCHSSGTGIQLIKAKTLTFNLQSLPYKSVFIGQPQLFSITDATSSLTSHICAKKLTFYWPLAWSSRPHVFSLALHSWCCCRLFNNAEKSKMAYLQNNRPKNDCSFIVRKKKKKKKMALWVKDKCLDDSDPEIQKKRHGHETSSAI